MTFKTLGVKKLNLQVKKNKLIADRIYSMDLYCDASQYDMHDFVAGQFLHIKASDAIDPLLRRPISICDIDITEKLLTILFRVEGKGTELLSKAAPGQFVDALGPLGNGFPQNLKEGQTALMVGGGIGVPPLYHLSKELHAKGVKIKAVLGFNSRKDVFLEDEFKALGETYVTTMDGTHGHAGLVTSIFDQNNKDAQIDQWDALYTCGPNAMMRAIQEMFGQKATGSNQEFAGLPGFMSLEQRMGCGVGACLACVCKPSEALASKKIEPLSDWQKSYKKICCDGPVFDLQEVAL